MSEQPPVDKQRRRNLKILIGAGGALVVGGIAGLYARGFSGGEAQTVTVTVAPEAQPQPPPQPQLQPQPEAPGTRAWTLDDYARNTLSGGPPKDGIPSIDNPRFETAAQADKFLQPNDVVFGLNYKGEVRAYPQIVLVWHEILNDVIGGERLSITYCPLTGSTVGYKGTSKADGKPLTFGTTGRLVNSNLLMYDRETDSAWPQILGRAITGVQKGARLETVHVAWTTWERWKTLHPDSRVLNRDTGFFRQYGRDPYGSYTGSDRGYYSFDGTFFPVMADSSRYHAKEVVIGTLTDTNQLAILKRRVARDRIVEAELGETPIVALYDARLDEARVFDRRIEGRVAAFNSDGPNFVDSISRTTWSPEGVGIAGSLQGRQLKPVTAFDVMWFAWFAFYPPTRVIE